MIAKTIPGRCIMRSYREESSLECVCVMQNPINSRCKISQASCEIVRIVNRPRILIIRGNLDLRCGDCGWKKARWRKWRYRGGKGGGVILIQTKGRKDFQRTSPLVHHSQFFPVAIEVTPCARGSWFFLSVEFSDGFQSGVTPQRATSGTVGRAVGPHST